MAEIKDSHKLRKINKMILTEDDEGYAVLLQRLFERAEIKCELVWFPDGVKLLEYVKDGKLTGDELVLLDLNLPVMSGFEVLADLRKEYGKEELPVIVISTTIRDKEFQKCLELGANSFLKKPISYTELISVTEKIGVEL